MNNCCAAKRGCKETSREKEVQTDIRNIYLDVDCPSARARFSDLLYLLVLLGKNAVCKFHNRRETRNVNRSLDARRYREKIKPWFPMLRNKTALRYFQM